MMFNILISDPLSEEGIQPLRNAENMNIVIDTELTPEELAVKITDFDALLVRSQTQVTRELISKASNLKIIGRAGVGVDNIDLDAATEHGIIVVNAPNGNTNSAAEHTMAMIMSLSRKIPQAFNSLKNKRWDRKKYVGVELKNKTLGIIGLGRIGAEVAYRAKGQRMNITAYDPFLTEEKADKMGIGYGTVEDVLQVADFITIHTPLLKETRHLLNEDAFKLMKDGVQIVNCARGGIIDEEALYHAITSKKVAGAALDVFEEEPFMDNKLLELPEVIATPHLGASTIEAQEMVAIDVCHDVISLLTGETVKNPVNLPSVPGEILNKIEPYFNLAEKLGDFLIHLTDEVIEEVNIYYSGDLYDVEVAPLTRNTVKGLLKRHLGNHVNDVNALFLAEKRGITIQENKTPKARGFTNLIKVEVKTKSESRSVSGTLLNGLGPRIVKVDHYSVDFTPKGHVVVIHHKDQPGVIGKMGSLLSQHNINIATMQVDRSDVGGDAIMMLTVDKHMEKDELEALKSVEEIYDVMVVDL
ncbi:phosphoglycerate dehydrogenase [Virgibacillus profundi]|uniref:D-3-phosphoglycerate dehydrogenase n=1 Tax=Virgibacillus profundi TaxID=2024555 RepID=A0A2A2IFB3_9BACI|nr:phosphoglycerate dehydrogenase [Virgibacillus profundi]PAV29840.1 phosphoglycerate dehydrogenase [Virgibacillus profundi]PXY54012.1 phosphoglycerate dehydrogenase [Virgibacillus profundi]